ncbi:hypothetical protein [Mycoplasma phocoeninasale]|uniref:hypothetical protein n=1 Tax=Mycoplasma phocoeninasale TaxID=2726117 RepID=UPI0019676ECB|nr:hypothetical protein [Mycoplasma phocoeninasale]MBN0970460.1 hypothetical protein [Mycoplasma phocoeninasale]
MKKRNFKWWIALPATIATLPLIAAACDNGKTKDNPSNPDDGMKPAPDKPGNGMMPKPKDPQTPSPMNPNPNKPGNGMNTSPEPDKPGDGMNMIPNPNEKDEGMNNMLTPPTQEKPQDMNNHQDMMSNPNEPSGDMNGKEMNPKPGDMNNMDEMSNENSQDSNTDDNLKNIEKEIQEKKSQIKSYIEENIYIYDPKYKEFMDLLKKENTLMTLDNLEKNVINKITKDIKDKIKLIIEKGVFNNKEELIKQINDNINLTIPQLRELENKYSKMFLKNFIVGIESKDPRKYEEFSKIIETFKNDLELMVIFDYYDEQYKKLETLIKEHNLKSTFDKQIKDVDSFSKLYALIDSIEEIISKIKTIDNISYSKDGDGFKFDLKNRTIEDGDIVQVLYRIVDTKGTSTSGEIRDMPVTFMSSSSPNYEVKFKRKNPTDDKKSKIYLYGVVITNVKNNTRDYYLVPNLLLAKALDIISKSEFNHKDYPELKYTIEI